MITVEVFAYSDPQWDTIKTVIRDALDVDADQALRCRIESAATVHVLRSAFKSQTAGHKTNIKRLVALRDRTKALRDDMIDALAPSFTKAGIVHRPIPHNVEPLAETEDATATLVSVIEASIAAQRPQPAANTSKQIRDQFWSEALAIWVDIGGAETGIAAANFLVEVSKPVFRKVRADNGHKTTASLPQNYNSVVEWLRLRARAQERAATHRKASRNEHPFSPCVLGETRRKIFAYREGRPTNGATL
jgi:hypothetical protein